MIKKLAKKIMPVGSFRRKLAKKILVKLHLSSGLIIGYYNTWSQQHRESTPLEILENIQNGPLISIVVPAFNTPQRHLDALLYSIVSQAYPNWELILVNASDDPKYKKLIDECTSKDTRIKLIDVKNEGISENTNVGIKKSSGSYIAFVDHDDTLDPFALYEVALRITKEGAELIYSDEDKISDDGEIFFDPHFKPDWSPDLLTHVNYINHLTVIKKELLLKVGLLNPERDGAQDYDLVLRITDLNPVIRHVSKTLYHWRAATGSTAYDFSSKKKVTDVAKVSLEEHFMRHNVKVKVTPKENRPGFYSLRFNKPSEISVVITPFASDALLRQFTELLVKRSMVNSVKIELILPDGTQPRFESEGLNVKSIASDEHFLRNAIQVTSYPITVIINQIVLPISAEWLTQLCGPLSMEHVGAISPLIVRDGSIIEDCGVVLDSTGKLVPLFKDEPAFGNQTFFGNTDWVRDVDTLTGGVTVIRTEYLKSVKEISHTIPRFISDICSDNKLNGKFNMILTDVVLDNYSIRLKPYFIKDTFFNSNLLVTGRDYEPYTPESAAINILTKKFDRELV